MTQKDRKAPRVRNDRIIAAPADDPRIDDVKDLAKRSRKELEVFFVTAVEMTDKKVHIEGWEGRSVAEELIYKAARRYIGGDGEK
jgi:inorganic pyrophosphatase